VTDGEVLARHRALAEVAVHELQDVAAAGLDPF